ncbi:MAG TPA: hypothetical protein VD927_01030 [Chryseosolibacter sp.]|nr:hypothetical protein [Chryseosolibacter sp.]
MKLSCVVSFICLSLCAFAQTRNTISPNESHKGYELFELATLPKHVKEASGLAMSRSNFLWTHNDGGPPMLFCFDTLGNLQRSLQLNHPNAGWESLATDKDGMMYIGAFGNNKNDKRELKIYVIPDPETITARVITAEIIRYKYSDQRAYPASDEGKNFDMDAFIAMDDALYLFSKNRTRPFTGYTRVYKLPKRPGTYEAQVVDSIYLGEGPMIDCWVTGADLSPDGKTLALLSHQYIWLIADFTPGNFSGGTLQRIALNHFSHKAGITFSGNNRLYIVDERELDLIGGKLYRIDLKKPCRKLQ